MEENGDPEGAVGGPTGMTVGAGERVWEKSWSVEEMRKSADNWSLAGDAGLLLHLQSFSQNILSKTHDIQQQVDQLMYDMKLAGVRVDNVFNDFIGLANTQFVENRVYDDDTSQEVSETPGAEEEKEKTREQRENELVPKISLAVKLGLSIIDSAYENLDINEANSDSEDDDDDTPYKIQPLLESHDPYLHRALPYLIGSSAFMQDDDVGLVDIPSDVEDSDDGGSVSASESEDDAETESEEQEESDESTSDKEENSFQPKPTRTSKFDESASESGSDLFDEGNDKQEGSIPSSDEDMAENVTSGRDFSSELAAKIGSMQNPEVDSPEPKLKQQKAKENSKKKKSNSISKHKDIDEDDLFGAPGDADEDSPFGKKGGMFSSGGGLFEDEDDEGDLFDDIVSNEKRNEKQDSSEKQSSPAVKPKDTVRTVKSPKSKPKSTGGGLFGGDDDDEEDDLFASLPSKKETKPNPRSSKPVQSFLDDSDEEEDLFEEKSVRSTDSSRATSEETSSQLPKKKMPAGAVSMFGGAANPLAEALKAKRQFARSDSDDDNETDNSEESSQYRKELPSSVPSKTSKEDANSLFDDDDADDLFDSKPTPVVSKTAKEPIKAKSKPSFLAGFDDDDDEDDDLFSVMKKPIKKEESKQGARPKSGSLLFDDDTQDLFATDTSKGKGSNASVAPAMGEVTTKEAAKKPSTKALSLFDDDGSDEDLFGAAAPPAKSPGKSRSRTKSKSLFEDEDILFGTAEESPPVDLFGPSSPVSPSKQTPSSEKASSKADLSPVAQPAKNTPLRSDSADQDDDDADGDLFSSAPKKEEKKQTDAASFRKPDILGGKRLAGAVSMFGGLNPADILKNRKGPSGPESSEVETDAPNSKPFDPLGGDSDGEDLFSSAKPVKAVQLPTKPKAIGGTAAPGRPPFMPPIAASLPREDTTPVGFEDDISQAKTLDSVQKNRVRILTKRRPPTRRGRQAAAVVEDSTDVHEPSMSMPPPHDTFAAETKPSNHPNLTSNKHLPVEDDIFNSKPMPPKPVVKKKSDQEKSYMAKKEVSNKPDDLFPQMDATKEEPKNQTNPEAGDMFTTGFEPPPMDDEEDEDDIFSIRKATNKPALVDDVDDDDIFSSSAKNSSAKKKTSSGPSLLIHEPPPFPDDDEEDDDDDEDIFSSSVSKSKITNPPLDHNKVRYNLQSDVVQAKTDSGDIDDIFSPSKKKVEKDLFSASPKGDQSASNPLAHDDMFDSGLPSASGKSSMMKEETATDITSEKKSKNVVVEDDDDIFGSSFSKPSKKTKIKTDDIFTEPASNDTKVTLDDDIFGVPTANINKSSDDQNISVNNEEDIFASSTRPKTSKAKPLDDNIFDTPSSKVASKPIIMDEDDDDIFAPAKKTTRKIKKATTKDESLFTDNTDIFSDLPAPKAKEKSAKKKAKGGASLFAGDVDDIFADVSSKPKAKKTVKSTSKTTKPSSSASPVDIFDDPLNALK